MICIIEAQPTPSSPPLILIAVMLYRFMVLLTAVSQLVYGHRTIGPRPQAIKLTAVSNQEIFCAHCLRLALPFDKVGGASEIKINKLSGIRLALPFDKIGGASEIKINKFILYFSRLALPLYTIILIWNIH